MQIIPAVGNHSAQNIVINILEGPEGNHVVLVLLEVPVGGIHVVEVLLEILVVVGRPGVALVGGLCSLVGEVRGNHEGALAGDPWVVLEGLPLEVLVGDVQEGAADVGMVGQPGT